MENSADGAEAAALPSERAEELTPSKRRLRLLLVSVLITSACGISYELLIGAIASYLLGGSVMQFSLTIGTFLASMGLGAYISGFINDRLLERFIAVEIAISIVGGLSGCLLFIAFTYTGFYYLVMFGLIVVVGALIGLEIPLLTRYMQRYHPLKKSIADVFALDYVGSLLASILFPLVFLPYLGIFKTSLVVGLFNLVVALATLYFFRPFTTRVRRFVVIAAIFGIVLSGLLGAANNIISTLEAKLYRDEVIYAEQTPYQRMVLTRYRDDIRLFLDGSLQFSSRDEYRYHESLVHPAMSSTASRRDVLVIGGGDGLVLKQVLKYKDVKRATLVDIDPAMTRLARNHPLLQRLNRRSLADPRVRVVNEDAYRFVERSSELFGVIIVDLPDPRREALAKLYSSAFYRLLRRHLAPGGAIATQATSPLFAAKTFWCIVATARSTGLAATPYHTYIPSFGDWGFVLLSRKSVDLSRSKLRVKTKYWRPSMMPTLRHFPPDQKPPKVDVNRLDRPVILEYYQKGWVDWL